jgi:mannose-6-phosphate isomerase-like protein (cupin superfamily)
MSHVKNIVKKPWGYEYLAYENEQVALWFLYIKHNHQTSMHCHPNKTTGLTLIDGEAVVSFLADKHPLRQNDKFMIRKGLFHSTKAVDPRGAWVLEIETPVDKHDLVRLRDSYGREGKPYEDSAFEYPKQDSSIWIEEPIGEKPNVYRIEKCDLVVAKVSDISFFENVKSEQNIMFLKGGIMTEYDINVAGPGDIVSSKVLKELIQVFTKIHEDTIVMIMERDV